MSPWEASSLNNQVSSLLDLEKGQATDDRAQASEEEPDVRMGGSGRRMVSRAGESRVAGTCMLFWWACKLTQPCWRETWAQGEKPSLKVFDTEVPSLELYPK